MPPPSRHNESLSRPNLRSLGWWVRDHDGELALAQWPNPALAVWLAAIVVGWTGVLGAARAATLAGVGQGALIVWALDELVRGASPARRLLGAAILLGQLVRLFSQP